MATLRQRRGQRLQGYGFTPYEAREYSRVSRDGMSAPYFKAMVKDRRTLLRQAEEEGWSKKRYRKEIGQMYIDKKHLKTAKGITRIDPWAALRDYEEESKRRGDEFTSPWRKKTQRISERKQEKKRVTRADMVRSNIRSLERQLERTTNPSKREDIRTRLNYLRLQLERM